MSVFDSILSKLKLSQFSKPEQMVLETASQTQAPSSNGLEQSDIDKKWLKPLLGLGVFFILIIAVLLWIVFAPQKNKPKVLNLPNSITTSVTSVPEVEKIVEISGNILFQGYASEEAYLVVAEKGKDSDEFKSVLTGFVAKAGIIPWIWKDAKSGENYEIKAQLKVRGITVLESAPVSVSAPATGVALAIVSEQSPPAPQTAQIQGLIDLHGYIPNNASISILSDDQVSSNFQTVLSSITATDSAAWNWTGAASGKTYNVKAQLLDSLGNNISSSSAKTVTAPSSGLVLDLTSTAKPVTATVTGLFGTIVLNGNIPSSSYITLATRPTGTTSFSQVASNISATNGVSWSWNNAQAGQQYDIQAYLWSNSKPYSQSQILTVTAPSSGDVLTINAQQQLAAPSGDTISVSCGGQSNSLSQATIYYNKKANLSNVVTYNIIVVLASQGSQVLNTTITPVSTTQSQSLTTTYIFSPNVTYYAQYAYSTSNSNTFSPLSPAVQFSCT